MSDDEDERTLRKVSVIRAEMDEEKQEHANLKINDALDKCKIEKDIATFMKKEFDDKFSGTWHCIVGKCFGCSINRTESEQLCV